MSRHQYQPRTANTLNPNKAVTQGSIKTILHSPRRHPPIRLRHYKKKKNAHDTLTDLSYTEKTQHTEKRQMLPPPQSILLVITVEAALLSAGDRERMFANTEVDMTQAPQVEPGAVQKVAPYARFITWSCARSRRSRMLHH